MRQVWITKAGAPEVLQVKEAADPRAEAGHVRIRVAASGVNFADIAARMGTYPDAPPIPCVVGYEVAGTVDQVGVGVTGFKEGDRVLAFTRFGGYSDCVAAPVVQVRPIPDCLSFEQAASIPVNYGTAWIMLVKLGNVSAGDTVLVHAAAGGVGQAALQICKWRGASVIGTASAGKHERLRAAGVVHCIDYTTQDFQAEVMKYTNGRGVDIALDAVGGNSFRKSYRCLAPLGRLFCFGASSMSTGETANYLSLLKTLVTIPFFHPLPLIDKNRGVFGTNMGHLWDVMDKLGKEIDQILALTQSGDLHPVIDKTFKFGEAGEAHRYMQQRKNFGKVLLVP